MEQEKERILTGDRVTGPLHIGHYVGSLKLRVDLQHRCETLVLLADVQALTTHFDRPQTLNGHLRQVALDYLAVGIDPEKTAFVVQSLVPEIAELTVFYSMFVTVNALRHNPTVKAEALERGYQELYYGFLGYPVSQAADITAFKATLVPVGDDQLPHIEQTRRIVRRFNELYRPVLPEPRALLGETPRLPALDGRGKMSKSAGNTIALGATAKEVQDTLRRAVTDPARLRKDDPGHPEVCPVYACHQAFGTAEETADIGERCHAGAIGCAACKTRLASILNETLEPMRERRAEYAAHPGRVDDILQSGTAHARRIAKETMREVRQAMGLDYFGEGAKIFT